VSEFNPGESSRVRKPICAFRAIRAALAAFFLAGAFQLAHANGCVAARSNQGIMDELCGGGTAVSSPADHDPAWLRRLTVNIGFREFNSFRHFIGTDEQTQRELNHNQVENHQLLFDVGINYQISRRWSVIADVPVLQGSRNQIYPPVGVYRIGGIGDMRVGVQSWICLCSPNSPADTTRRNRSRHDHLRSRRLTNFSHHGRSFEKRHLLPY
jgi:hypothetical protein